MTHKNKEICFCGKIVEVKNEYDCCDECYEYILKNKDKLETYTHSLKNIAKNLDKQLNSFKIKEGEDYE